MERRQFLQQAGLGAATVTIFAAPSIAAAATTPQPQKTKEAA
jgi:hypothetical protein